MIICLLQWDVTNLSDPLANCQTPDGLRHIAFWQRIMHITYNETRLTGT